MAALKFIQQREAEFSQTGAGVEDDDIATVPDFDASGVAAVTHGVRAGRRYRTANAPKLDVRGRFNEFTLTQTREKTNLKIDGRGKLVGRAVAFGGVGICPPTFYFGAAASLFTLFKAKAGGLGETRTLDQCLKRALLYRLSYQPNRAEENR